MASASKLLRLGRLPRFLINLSPHHLPVLRHRLIVSSCFPLDFPWKIPCPGCLDSSIISRTFCSQGPAPIDYRSVLQEDEFHNLANSTLHDLLEKIEEYGDSVQIDGFDVDYGNEVLTVKLGSSGTYVLNKQTPNRQIWLSSPVSGPARFDWDSESHGWVYRRTRANLYGLLEEELERLCGQPIKLS